MKTLAALLALSLTALAAEPVSVAVARDGSILRHEELVLDRKAKVLRRKTKEYPLEDFYLVEGKGDVLLWTEDYASRIRGYEFLAREIILERAETLFRAALRYKDAQLARNLFNVAQENGMKSSAVERSRKSLRRLESKGGKRNIKADEVMKDAEQLDDILPDLFFKRTTIELDAKGPAGLHMLREMLRRAPSHKQANARLDKLAPKDFTLGDARLWLDWHLDVERHGATLATRDSFDMRQALKYWRKDLNGIQSGVVLVITPVKDARTLGRMVACSKLTTDLLGELFASYPVRRKEIKPLRVFLFESQEEYIKKSGAFRPMKSTEFLKWSAGHYSPDEGISRLFWHTKRDAESRIVGTAVHELAHHWLADANPAYNHVEGRRSPMTPGFWIVEGIAEFLQEGDHRGRTAEVPAAAPGLDGQHHGRQRVDEAQQRPHGGAESARAAREVGEDPEPDDQEQTQQEGEREGPAHQTGAQTRAACKQECHAGDGAAGVRPDPGGRTFSFGGIHRIVPRFDREEGPVAGKLPQSRGRFRLPRISRQEFPSTSARDSGKRPWRGPAEGGAGPAGLRFRRSARERIPRFFPWPRGRRSAAAGPAETAHARPAHGRGRGCTPDPAPGRSVRAGVRRGSRAPAG